MRVRALLLSLVIPAFGAGITACGRQAPARAPRVQLELRSPTDGARVSGSSITVTGTVSPARAEVRVFGQPASVRSNGSFSTRVSLRAGVNLIDVLASLPHSSGAMSALRIERYVLVAVPQVLGDAPGDAEAALRSVRLVPKVQSSDNSITSLLPLPEQVCTVSPQPGTRVSPGSTVTLSTSTVCGLSSTASAPQAPPPQSAPAVKSTPVAPPVSHGPGQGNGPDGTGPPGQDKPKHHDFQGDQGNGNGNGD